MPLDRQALGTSALRARCLQLGSLKYPWARLTSFSPRPLSVNVRARYAQQHVQSKSAQSAGLAHGLLSLL
jgi:hypothetical protein